MEEKNRNSQDQPIRTGRTYAERNPAGKIYEVDPEAVLRLKAYISEKEKQGTAKPKSEKGDILANILRTQYERQAELNASRRKPEIPAELARQWHITYYQAGESIFDVAERACVGRNRLTRRWRELGLPISRKVEERTWQPDERVD